jgi:hypothetical protein
MRNGKTLRGPLTLILLTALTAFSTCATTGSVSAGARETLAALRPPVPQAPETEPVRFEEKDGGLRLSYNDYRALERNVIALREYAARLRLIVEFYTGGR